MLKDLPRYECLLEAARLFPDLDPSACEVYLQLLRTGDEVFEVESRYLNALGISQGRFTVLMQLTEPRVGCGQGPVALSPADIADRAGVTRATVTGLIDTLERDDFVLRKPAEHDRRMMTVSLTKAGEAFVASLLPGYFQRVAAIMRGLSLEERRTLVNLLLKIQEGTAAAESRSETGATT